MKKWHSFLSVFQFPLKLLFIALILLSLSSLVLSSSVGIFWSTDNLYVIQGAYLARSVGNFIVVNFPFFVLIKMTSRRGSEGIQSEVGILGYIVFLITTMYFSDQTLGTTYFYSTFGLAINTSSIPGLSGGTQYPLQMGLVGAMAIGFLARYVYNRSRGKHQYGFLGFIDKNAYAIILVVVGAFLFGITFSYLWPMLMEMLQQVFEFIATDINNPVNLFVYGMFDRGLSVLNLGGIIRNVFWFGEFGGSWIDIAGVGYTGDVSIWAAQTARDVFPLGYGRFITPYYILNLFAVPGMLIALYMMHSDKYERRRYRGFFVVALLLSLFGGTLLPLEIFLLVMAPLLFGMHLLATGCMFAVCQAMSIYFGFTYTGNPISALPGNLFDILVYLQNPNATSTIRWIVTLGAIAFVGYFLMTQVYYRYLALDLFSTGLTKKKVGYFVNALGGIGNIKRIDSSLYRVVVQLDDSTLIDFEQIKGIGGEKITEVKAGFAIQFGASSTIIKNRVNKRLKQTKRKIG